MEIYILTEGGKKLGFGHISRCVSIYQAFQKYGFKPQMLVNTDQTTRSILEGVNYKLTNWLIYNRQKIQSLASGNIVLIDSYRASKDYYAKISTFSKMAVYLDDFKRITYPKGIIINSAIKTNTLDYPNRKRCKYLLGSSYTPLRKPFWNVPKKTIKPEVSDLLITFGGSMMQSIAHYYLETIMKYNPKIKIKVISTHKTRKLFDIMKTFPVVKILTQQTATDLKNEMLSSDLAITSGGQILNELACCGLPSISICVAENQYLNIQGWEEKGFIKFAGIWHYKDIHLKIFEFLNKMEDQKIRQRMSKIGQTIIDGQGSLRIVKEILKWAN